MFSPVEQDQSLWPSRSHLKESVHVLLGDISLQGGVGVLAHHVIDGSHDLGHFLATKREHALRWGLSGRASARRESAASPLCWCSHPCWCRRGGRSTPAFPSLCLAAVSTALLQSPGSNQRKTLDSERFTEETYRRQPLTCSHVWSAWL